jgi:hypothetical protein
MNTRNIATLTQAELGIEANIIEILDAQGRAIEYQGFVQSPKMTYPQYAGFCFVSDGDEALSQLEAKAILLASDVEAELAPIATCACGAELVGDGCNNSDCLNFPPTITPKTKSKKSKAPKRSRHDFPDAGDILAAFRLEVQRTNGLMRELEQVA